MSDDTRIVLVRHGETEWNATKRMQGHLDSTLTPRGVEQARALAPRIAAESYAAIYASDLGRVRATVAHMLGEERAVTYRAELRERCFGEWDGLSHQQMAERTSEVEREAVMQNDADAAPAGGESLRGFQQRCWTAIERIAADHPGEQVLVVTHGGFLRSCFKQIIGIGITAPRHFSVINASYNVIRYDGSDWQVETWGSAEHMAGVGFIPL